MRRHVLPKLEDLDLDVRDVAEAMARRSGLGLEDWMAAALAKRLDPREQRPKPERRRAGENLDRILAHLTESSRKDHGRDAADRERPGDPLARDEASKTAIALESMAGWIEQAEQRLTETARMSADQQDRIASVLAEALSAVKARLDTVERHVTSERSVPARIEFPVADAMRALAPLSETLTGLRSDMSRLAERLEQPVSLVLPPAIEEIRGDIERLRSDIGGLATHDDIAALDRTVRGLAEDLGPERSGKDILTLARSIAAAHRQVQGLSGELAEEVHRRLGSEIENIGKKVESAARSGVDRSVIEFLAGQIVDLRQDLAQRAEPRQIERLSAEVGALSRQIAELRENQVGRSDFAALKASLENVCAALGRTVAAQEGSTVPEQLESLSRRLDTLAARPEPKPADLDPITEQLALLTERMAAVTDARHGQEPLLKRFDRIEEELRQVGRQTDLSTVELMLRALDEKLDRQSVPPSALDTLEQRIAALADRLADMPSEPFRQAFEEATSHLRKLQDESAAIAERAAKAALKDVQINAPATDDLDALKQGFVELKALHTRSDKKTQDTLRTVRDALETLIARYPEPGMTALRPLAAQSPDATDKSSADRLEAAVRRLHAAALSQVAEASASPRDPAPAAEPPKVEPEPTRGIATAISPQEADLGNVRASFIAAARRAAQTTNPDKAASLPVEGAVAAEDEVDEDPTPVPAETVSLPGPSLIERIRRSFDARRRPLLFGLAFLILAAGTAQILSVGPGSPDPAPEQAAQETTREPAEVGSTEASSVPDTSGLFQPTSLATGPVAPAARFRVDPGAVGELPAQVPGELRKAALSGDALAVYEIASRVSEGRGLEYDPSLAAYLFEKAASAGFAPAQERLAMLYEKGMGIPRDAKLAMTWYERAAKGGNTRAMHNLATLLASGSNGKPDYPAALRWYREAAESGVRDSQFNLGVLFARGIGTNPDLATAYKWFALAAAQGDDEAMKKRDEIARHMGAAELAAAKASVTGWQPRFVDPSANAVLPAPDGRTAALSQGHAPDGKS